ncbi:hypothetical protein BV898_15079 [Hypsibius exemplaris]|uniref:Uncharacterized protein n=1 Tax=Hypsibius exemplaris TaxID=2072580 RepID=A0A9X6RJX3_HYPEX|nr:hypothetical protein BV898_15079 [Hypsibius exemplaris]
MQKANLRHLCDPDCAKERDLARSWQCFHRGFDGDDDVSEGQTSRTHKISTDDVAFNLNPAPSKETSSTKSHLPVDRSAKRICKSHVL